MINYIISLIVETFKICKFLILLVILKLFHSQNYFLSIIVVSILLIMTVIFFFYLNNKKFKIPKKNKINSKKFILYLLLLTNFMIGYYTQTLYTAPITLICFIPFWTNKYNFFNKKIYFDFFLIISYLSLLLFSYFNFILFKIEIFLILISTRITINLIFEIKDNYNKLNFLNWKNLNGDFIFDNSNIDYEIIKNYDTKIFPKKIHRDKINNLAFVLKNQKEILFYHNSDKNKNFEIIIFKNFFHLINNNFFFTNYNKSHNSKIFKPNNIFKRKLFNFLLTKGTSIHKKYNLSDIPKYYLNYDTVLNNKKFLFFLNQYQFCKKYNLADYYTKKVRNNFTINTHLILNLNSFFQTNNMIFSLDLNPIESNCFLIFKNNSSYLMLLNYLSKLSEQNLCKINSRVFLDLIYYFFNDKDYFALFFTLKLFENYYSLLIQYKNIKHNNLYL